MTNNVTPNVVRLLADADQESAAVLEYAKTKRAADADDFSFWAMDITVGEHCESGVNESEYFVVDIETGILIIEAARKIITERASLVSRPHHPTTENKGE